MIYNQVSILPFPLKSNLGFCVKKKKKKEKLILLFANFGIAVLFSCQNDNLPVYEEFNNLHISDQEKNFISVSKKSIK